MATRRSKERDAAAASALESYKGHLREISSLLLNATNQVETNAHEANEREITWANVGDAARAREIAVHLAWVLGTITTEEAKANHGVSL